MAGKISIDRAGLVSGALTVKARNWRDMLALAIANGLIPQELAGPVENALDMLAGLSGDKKTLDTPLTFENGKTKLGPLVLGPAPRIARR